MTKKWEAQRRVPSYTKIAQTTKPKPWVLLRKDERLREPYSVTFHYSRLTHIAQTKKILSHGCFPRRDEATLKLHCRIRNKSAPKFTKNWDPQSTMPSYIHCQTKKNSTHGCFLRRDEANLKQLCQIRNKIAPKIYQKNEPASDTRSASITHISQTSPKQHNLSSEHSPKYMEPARIRPNPQQTCT